MKFSIRDLLLVTVIVALVLGWWVSYRSLREENTRLKKKEADRILEEVMTPEMPLPEVPILSEPAQKLPSD